MAKSTSSAGKAKVAKQSDWKKPYPDFPLSYHPPSGRLYKKIRGKRVYFGYARDWQAAIDKYQFERDDLYAGRTPRPHSESQLTLKDLCNAFLTLKKHRVDTGELSARSFRDYNKTTDFLIAFLGRNSVVEEIRPDDLRRVREELAMHLGPVSLGNEIGRVRVVLNFAYDEELIDRPVRIGKNFRKPSKRTLRQHKAEREAVNGKRFFGASELRAMLDAADIHLKAMILLACNCGFGNSDCGRLPLSVVDLDTGWVAFPRPKTGIARRCPLWSETVAALRTSLAKRQTPRNEADQNLAFITKYGLPWFKEGTSTNPISQQFRKLLVSLEVHRKGVGFYALRHTFETVAGESKDQVAVNFLMGHVDETMAGEYREHISDDRLHAVAGHVHNWLFGNATGELEGETTEG